VVRATAQRVIKAAQGVLERLDTAHGHGGHPLAGDGLAEGADRAASERPVAAVSRQAPSTAVDASVGRA
jgi:hypothetical protein